MNVSFEHVIVIGMDRAVRIFLHKHRQALRDSRHNRQICRVVADRVTHRVNAQAYSGVNQCSCESLCHIWFICC